MERPFGFTEDWRQRSAAGSSTAMHRFCFSRGKRLSVNSTIPELLRSDKRLQYFLLHGGSTDVVGALVLYQF